MSRSWVWALGSLLLVLGGSQSLEGQLPDAFLSHFGATRTRELGVDWSLGLGASLLSEFGSSWDGPPNVWTSEAHFSNHDRLATTVGYNYLNGGGQWETAAGAGWLALEGSGTLGVTSDLVTEWWQDELHSFGRIPHVSRPRVSPQDALYGLEFAGAYWRSWYFPRVDVHLFPTLGLMWASYHREANAEFGLAVRWRKVRIQGSAGAGLLLKRRGVVPSPVAQRLKSSYSRFQGVLSLDRNQLGAWSKVTPVPGVGLTWSSGLFPQEREFFVSFFLEVPLPGNHTIRVEHVNDHVNGKDRGPTGGLRVSYVAR